MIFLSFTFATQTSKPMNVRVSQNVHVSRQIAASSEATEVLTASRPMALTRNEDSSPKTRDRRITQLAKMVIDRYYSKFIEFTAGVF